MVKLLAPDHNASMTAFGVEYSAVDSDDCSIDVPIEAVQAAYAHGFKPFPAETNPDRFSAMKRLELLAWLAEHSPENAGGWIGLKVDEIRQRCRKAYHASLVRRIYGDTNEALGAPIPAQSHSLKTGLVTADAPQPVQDVENAVTGVAGALGDLVNGIATGAADVVSAVTGQPLEATEKPQEPPPAAEDDGTEKSEMAAGAPSQPQDAHNPPE